MQFLKPTSQYFIDDDNVVDSKAGKETYGFDRFYFRDAKQFWGLEDFMNVKETAVTNAVNLSLFTVNFSAALAKPFCQQNQGFSMLSLKSHYRGYRYATKTIKTLPQNPDAILLPAIFQQIARLGAIHPVSRPVSSQ